jgi:hypothetical protein
MSPSGEQHAVVQVTEVVRRMARRVDRLQHQAAAEVERLAARQQHVGLETRILALGKVGDAAMHRRAGRGLDGARRR